MGEVSCLWQNLIREEAGPASRWPVSGGSENGITWKNGTKNTTFLKLFFTKIAKNCNLFLARASTTSKEKTRTFSLKKFHKAISKKKSNSFLRFKIHMPLFLFRKTVFFDQIIQCHVQFLLDGQIRHLKFSLNERKFFIFIKILWSEITGI